MPGRADHEPARRGHRVRLAHLDADPSVIGRNYPAALPVVGDARLGLELLLGAISRVSTDPVHTKRAQMAATAARAEVRTQIGDDHTRIMDAIRRHTLRAAVIVRDATVPAYRWGDRLLPILAPRTSIRPASAAIGPGLPLALGAAAGSGHPAVLIAGDGGFMLHVGELVTPDFPPWPPRWASTRPGSPARPSSKPASATPSHRASRPCSTSTCAR
ncbi:MAG TPA: thiamine pyrophosphate-dependent enzyme [Streptosporangiaceae bacterium]